MTDASTKAREIGGERLIQFFDAILAEQRKRWNAPDWRLIVPIPADITNWTDIAAALAEQSRPQPEGMETTAHQRAVLLAQAETDIHSDAAGSLIAPTALADLCHDIEFLLSRTTEAKAVELETTEDECREWIGRCASLDEVGTKPNHETVRTARFARDIMALRARVQTLETVTDMQAETNAKLSSLPSAAEAVEAEALAKRATKWADARCLSQPDGAQIMRDAAAILRRSAVPSAVREWQDIETAAMEMRERAAKLIETMGENNVGMVHDINRREAAAIRALPLPVPPARKEPGNV